MAFSFIGMMLPLTAVGQGAVWDGSADTEWSGEGTASSPYLISSAEELAGLAKRTNSGEEFEGVYFKLTADVRLSDTSKPADERLLWVPIGLYALNNDDPETNPGGWTSTEHWFKGHFDGNGHTIADLWYSGTTDFDDWNDPFGSGQLDFSAWYKALFGLLDGATITNLRVENANVGGTALIGGICIRAQNTTFSDIYISGAIKSGSIEAGGSAAAVAVEATDCSFTRCTVDAQVYGKSSTGGLVGRLMGASSVEDCTVAGSVTGCVTLGGFVGASGPTEGGTDSPVITNCSSSAEVTVIPGRNQGTSGGGFVGINEGVISLCNATGKVHVTTGAGAGFCDSNRGIITSCYATGEVYNEEYGVSIAGFVNENGYSLAYDEKAKGVIENCFSTGRVHAPEAPSDVIAIPTRIYGFAISSADDAGSRLANCYYDKTATPAISFSTVIGEFGASTEHMQSKVFTDSLNHMAAIMGTNLWQYNAGALPTYTAAKATAVAPFFNGGNGTEASPFVIADKRQLENLAYATNHGWDFSGQYVSQNADIALNAPMEQWGEQMPTPWSPIGYFKKDCEKAAYFRGVYDGNLHTIANMYIDDLENDYLGLFGVLGDGVHIRNLGVTDAWVNGALTAGIVAGASKIHNDMNKGVRQLTRVWTSGQVSARTCASILGTSPAVGRMILTACSSMAAITKKNNTSRYSYPFVDNEIVIDTEIRYYGCWFGGTLAASMPIFNTGFIGTYVDGTKNTVPTDASTAELLTTAYMQSKAFVNDLNYAAALNGVDAGWGYTAASYPTFGGEKPTLAVTCSDDVNADISFKVFKGTTMLPLINPEREGYKFYAWYTDSDYSNMFRFGTDKFTSDTTLYAKWMQDIVADYEIFKNKFATTFKITTAAQLYGLSDIVNGVAPGIERNDFAGKTITLENDIVLNDPEYYDEWGKSVTPVRFLSIGDYNSVGHFPFNGKFDGKGHAIIGLYTSTKILADNTSTPGGGLFDEIGPKAEVTNLYIHNALTEGEGGILAASNEGKVSRCGVDGRMIIGQPEGAGGNQAAGLIGEIKAAGSVTECFANVDITAYEGSAAYGLIGFAYGSLSNSYATGTVTFVSGYGTYAGVVGGASKPLANCYAAVKLDWHYTNGFLDGTGGAYGSASASNVYYDRTLLGADPFGGYANIYARGTALRTDQMHTMAAFNGYDFDNVWGRCNDMNDGYPYLRWQAPGLANDPDGALAPVLVEKITLSQTSFDGEEGQTCQLTATVSPDDATDAGINWTSSDEAVATVSETGLVTITGGGDATITATAADGSGVTATCAVHGTKVFVAVWGIRLNEMSFHGFVGETLQLVATVSPDNATNKAVLFSSSDESVATVTADGFVTIVGEGSALINVVAADGNGATARCRVYGELCMVAEIIVRPADFHGEVGDTRQLIATVMPAEANNKTVEWLSTNESVATVSATGLVTITGEGYAEIIAKATDGSDVTGYCRVDGASGIDGIIAPDAEVDVYTLQGTHVYSGRLADAHLAAGMYLVRQGVEVFKTFVR